MKKFKVVKPCIDQDTKKELQPGELWQPSSDFEAGRHLAEQNVIPLDDTVIEQAVKKPPESRRKRTRKNGPKSHYSSNG